MSEVVHFRADPLKVKNFTRRLNGALKVPNGDQVAVTEIASLVASSLLFLANNYGLDQAKRIWAEASEAGITTMENEDYDRQQRECAAAFADRDHGQGPRSGHADAAPQGSRKSRSS